MVHLTIECLESQQFPPTHERGYSFLSHESVVSSAKVSCISPSSLGRRSDEGQRRIDD